MACPEAGGPLESIFQSQRGASEECSTIGKRKSCLRLSRRSRAALSACSVGAPVSVGGSSPGALTRGFHPPRSKKYLNRQGLKALPRLAIESFTLFRMNPTSEERQRSHTTCMILSTRCYLGRTHLQPHCLALARAIGSRFLLAVVTEPL